MGVTSSLLQQVTVATELSPAIDKWCSLLFATLSGMIAAAVLLACPRGMLSLDTARATSTLSQASGALLRRKGWSEDAQVCAAPHHSTGPRSTEQRPFKKLCSLVLTQRPVN